MDTYKKKKVSTQLVSTFKFNIHYICESLLDLAKYTHPDLILASHLNKLQIMFTLLYNYA